MNITIDGKEAARKINCYRIELNAKPNLLATTINNDRTLVIVVDMINGFCKKGALASQRSASKIEPIEQLLEKLPNTKKVFVRDCHSKDSIEFKSYPPHCLANDSESELVKELSDFDGIDIAKNSTNAFFALQNSVLDMHRYTNIVLVGVCTDICVMQLGLTLKAYFNEKNFTTNILTIIDCVDTFDSPLHDAELSNIFALKFLEGAGIDIYKSVV
ncbi:MAG: cysteine hydrolase [Firmicutes bacterium]|nr:cysteine hydrolase [Bacillota bacterium]